MTDLTDALAAKFEAIFGLPLGDRPTTNVGADEGPDAEGIKP